MNSGIFVRILFRGIAFKDIFATIKICVCHTRAASSRCPKKLQNAEVRTVQMQASPQQHSGIAIGHSGVT